MATSNHIFFIAGAELKITVYSVYVYFNRNLLSYSDLSIQGSMSKRNDKPVQNYLYSCPTLDAYALVLQDEQHSGELN